MMIKPSSIPFCCRFKDGEELVKGDHYIGGLLENLPLLIKNSTRDDIGEYTCTLANDVGWGRANGTIFVDVHCEF